MQYVSSCVWFMSLASCPQGPATQQQLQSVLPFEAELYSIVCIVFFMLHLSVSTWVLSAFGCLE